jgi:hypothetical protein
VSGCSLKYEQAAHRIFTFLLTEWLIPQVAQREVFSSEESSLARSMLWLFAGKRSEIPLPSENGRTMKDAFRQITDELNLVAHPVGRSKPRDRRASREWERTAREEKRAALHILQ